MSLPVPKLDDRSFQDIVDEARRELIPKYCPEWTDHNLSDPGITLIELFAWMMDMLLYRLNRVPRKNQIAFLNMMGVKLQAPTAAEAAITFELSHPQLLTIPAGTELATEHGESGEPISFRTSMDLAIIQPRLRYIFPDPGTDPQASVPLTPEAHLYLGFDDDISSLLLEVTLELAFGADPIATSGIDLEWQQWDADEARWEILESELQSLETAEENAGTNRQRLSTKLFLKSERKARLINEQDAYWIRIQLIVSQASADSSTTLSISNIACVAMGGTVVSRNEKTVVNEELGWSNGQHGQAFRLANPPIVAPLDPRREFIEVEVVDTLAQQGKNGAVNSVASTWEPWGRFVKDFALSRETDRDWVCDPLTGDIQFGPAIVQPDRTVRCFGMAPPTGSRIRITQYRCSKGAVGNVGARTLALKSAIPYVASATNRHAAVGGRDAETIDHAILRGADILRTRDRAVTAEDYETLAKTASSGVARAKCLPVPSGNSNHPSGNVTVLLVPDVAHIQRPTVKDMRVADHLETEVRCYLGDRRLLCTSLNLQEPNYRTVIVNAEVQVNSLADRAKTRERIEAELYRFLNPIYGGYKGAGWSFGRDLHVADIYNIVQRVQGVNYIRSVQLRNVDDREDVGGTFALEDNELLISGEHVVSCDQ